MEHQHRFHFWWRVLLAASLLSIAMGLLIAFWPNSPVFAPHTAALERVFFGGAMPEDARHLRSFLLGPLGGTIAGYFLMQTLIVAGPFRRREPWAWHAIAWPLLLWFAVDSTMSIYHGAAFNVWMINLSTLLLVGIPLVATRRAFIGNDPGP